MEKYLPQNGCPLPPPIMTSCDRKYRRESASVVDEYFSDEKPTPYSLNINLILPHTSHLRTGLYRPNKPLASHTIKTEPGLEVPCSMQNSQTLPDFTSVFSMPQNVNTLFAKPDMGGGGGAGGQLSSGTELHIGPQQPQVYHMPGSGADFTMTLSHSSQSGPGGGGAGGHGRTMLNLSGVGLTTTGGNGGDFAVPEHFYHPSPQSHTLPPPPPHSPPGRPETPPTAPLPPSPLSLPPPPSQRPRPRLLPHP